MIRIAKNTIYFYLISLFLFFGLELSAQTYTTVGGGCTDWTNGNCWDIVDETGCNPSNISATPPFTTNGCPVSVIIRHPMSVSGTRNFGGNFLSITAEGDDGVLVFDQNVTIAAGRSIEFITNNGGEIRINGELILNQGPGGQSPTPTQLNISGDKTGKVSTNDTKINNRTTLSVLAGGNFVNSEIIDFQGSNSIIEVWGEFQILGLEIQGGSSNQFNTYGNALVNVEKGIILAGSNQVNFGGNSTIIVEQDISVVGNATMTAKENAKVYICGNYPVPKEAGPGTVEKNDGKFLPCSFLPVDFLSFEVSLSDDRKSLVADWSTASESESSHFEVEYSRTGLGDFQVLGRVAAAGHATEVQHYRFSAALPHGSEEILYLRIKQVDQDGSSYYTDLMPLRLPKGTSERSPWQVFPNPTSGDAFRIHYEGRLSDSDFVHVRLLSFSHASLITASDMSQLNTLLADAFKLVPKGMYVLELTVGSEVSRLKVVKK